MHWEVLIIPLIALGVWILGTLFKSEDEKTKKAVRRPGNASGRDPRRRPATDLERFLEDARRRRDAETAPKPPPKSAPIARAPLRERPSQPREKSPRPAPSPKRREQAPVAVPVARLVAEPLVDEVVVVAPSREELPVPAPAPTTTRDTKPSPIVQQVRALLSDPQTAATAFALREIFDRPLCHRRTVRADPSTH